MRKVCIDDFATKKRHAYGTVMANIETGRIVDMLESRETADVTAWLATFPNLEVRVTGRLNAVCQGDKGGTPGCNAGKWQVPYIEGPYGCVTAVCPWNCRAEDSGPARCRAEQLLAQTAAQRYGFAGAAA